MSQRGVQLVIGKLLTDADFRRRFAVRGGECLVALRERGIDLSGIERGALAETDPGEWSRMASRIDRRLQWSSSVQSERTNERVRLRGRLTARQQRVLSGVCQGLSNKEIAVETGVSESAVKSTLQQLFRKAHVRRRTQLVRLVIENARDVTGDPQ